MFDATIAFERYRLEVVRSWPDGDEKKELLAKIEASFVAKYPPEGQRKTGAPVEVGFTDTGSVDPR